MLRSVEQKINGQYNVIFKNSDTSFIQVAKNQTFILICRKSESL